MSGPHAATGPCMHGVVDAICWQCTPDAEVLRIVAALLNGRGSVEDAHSSPFELLAKPLAVSNLSVSLVELRRLAADAIRDVHTLIHHDNNLEDPALDWTAAKLRQVKAETIAAFDRAAELVELVEAFAPGASVAPDEEEAECGAKRASGDRCTMPAGHAGNHRSEHTGETWPKETA